MQFGQLSRHILSFSTAFFVQLVREIPRVARAINFMGGVVPVDLDNVLVRIWRGRESGVLLSFRL